DSLESAYKDDVKRQQRAIPTPKFDEDLTETGDVVIGQHFRRSLRNGFLAPMSAGLPPSPVILDQPDPDLDIEDTRVKIKWRRNIDYRFYAYELWRDTVPNVVRPNGLQLITNGPDLLRENTKQVFTSKLVYRSFGPQTNRDNVGW